jgi:hypothetical protein
MENNTEKHTPTTFHEWTKQTFNWIDVDVKKYMQRAWTASSKANKAENTRLLKENGELKEQVEKIKSLLEEIQIDCDENTIGKLSGSYFDKIGNLLLTVKS